MDQVKGFGLGNQAFGLGPQIYQVGESRVKCHHNAIPYTPLSLHNTSTQHFPLVPASTAQA